MAFHYRNRKRELERQIEEFKRTEGASVLNNKLAVDHLTMNLIRQQAAVRQAFTDLYDFDPLLEQTKPTKDRSPLANILGQLAETARLAQKLADEVPHVPPDSEQFNYAETCRARYVEMRMRALTQMARIQTDALRTTNDAIRGGLSAVVSVRSMQLLAERKGLPAVESLTHLSDDEIADLEQKQQAALADADPQVPTTAEIERDALEQAVGIADAASGEQIRSAAAGE